MDSLIYSLRPDVAISLGVSSTVLGGYGVSSIKNPHLTKNDHMSSLATGLSSTMTGALFMGPSMEYLQNISEVETYIQSLSKEELEELSNKLDLMNEANSKKEIIDDLKAETIGEFQKKYYKIKTDSIWDR